MLSSSHSLCCEALSEERSAGNPHATFCGNRWQATATDDPVLAVKVRRSTHPHLAIEKGNPNDGERFIPIIHAHQAIFGVVPTSTAGDGGYASLDNVRQGRALGIKRVVFHKKRGIAYHDMGVKKKTFKKLRDFRAGIEGNISELKRVFGAGKALWKGLDGFHAFVWSSVISYNLVRLARAESG